MKLSQSRFNSLVQSTNSDIARYENLLAEKKRIKEIYGYEESGEEIERYENLLSVAKEIKSDLDSGKIYC